jgi:hypothetical protein
VARSVALVAGRVLTALALVSGLLMAFPGRLAAQQDAVTQMLASINGSRIANGLPPLALNADLSAAAQRHSEDMASNDFVDHVGSDGLTPEERIAAAGYPGYSAGIMAAELIHSESEAEPDWWMDQPEHGEVVLSTLYREIGIGIARRPEDGRIFWVLTLGSRPNALPVFINYGASQTDEREVIVTLSNEGAMVLGDGPQVMGLAQEMRVSNLPSLEDATWRIWAAQIEWELPPGEGVRTVYVEFRDREGRVATGQARITLVESGVSLSPLATSAPPGATPSPEIPRPGLAEEVGVVTSTRPVSVGTNLPAARPLIPSSRRSIPFYHWVTIRPEDAVPWACGLQAVAALLGFIVAARRQRPSPDDHEDMGGKGKWH